MSQTHLPPLRQELTLTPGSPTDQGAPTWMLQDPVGNRFFQLTWPAFEILSRWHLGNPDDVIASVNGQTTLTVGMDHIEGLIQFLSQQHLLLAQSAEDTARLNLYATATKTQGAKWLLKNYLFFRVPLIRPRVLLEFLAPYFAKVFTPQFWWAIFALLLVGIYLVSRQWDSFTHTFSAYSGFQALLGIGVALSFAKVLHEFGHALTAHRYGCRVPTMGIAFLVMLPVLYTDTTDAWKLSSRRARMHIGAAGMLSELVLAVLATLLWSFLPDGPLRAGVFLLATSTWLITLAINASPFMRFDGYFLLSDYLNMPNLHGRAFSLGLWWLREKLFGWGDPVPEQFPKKRERLLIAFAIGTALYRAILFISIALLVYHLFFKLLGILLMVVELIWFIAYPVQREIKIWWQRRASMRWQFETYRSTALACALIAFVIIPWQSNIRAPAVIGAEQAQGLYAVSSARVISDGIAQGTIVKAGQILVQLESPDLQYRLQLAQTKEQALRWQLEQQSFNPRLQMAGPALRKHWEGAQEIVNGLEERVKQLTVTAPFDGVIVERNTALTIGTWIAAGEQLFHIINPIGIKGEAYVNESDMMRLSKIINTDDKNKIANAGFIANQSQYPKLNCGIEEIDKFNLSQLDQPYIASQYGGSIATQQNKEGRLIPLQATFRVRLNNCIGVGGKNSLMQELAGMVSLQGERKSFVVRGFNKAVAVLHSEAGF
ncbi:MAG: HlyD family efflux transporter periplasmic adaptor subunit [Pseudomonadota bacterium]